MYPIVRFSGRLIAILIIVSTVTALGLTVPVLYQKLQGQSNNNKQTLTSNCINGACTTVTSICNNGQCTNQKQTPNSASENTLTAVTSKCINGACTTITSICSDSECANTTRTTSH